jgi:hypothetical protein
MDGAAHLPDEGGTALRRFLDSMVIDYEKWHDGIGYDLDALDALTPDERRSVEAMLLGREPDWRSLEALARLDTPRARAAITAALRHPDHEVRLAAARWAPPGAESDEDRTASLVDALGRAEPFAGLPATLDAVAAHHPPPVIDALLRGALHRPGAAAVHYAAMLLYLHGEAAEPFDWNHRPFFLRFDATDRAERERAFTELCERIGVDVRRFIG